MLSVLLSLLASRSLLILVEHKEITEEEFAGFFCEALQGKFFCFE